MRIISQLLTAVRKPLMVNGIMCKLDNERQVHAYPQAIDFHISTKKSVPVNRNAYNH